MLTVTDVSKMPYLRKIIAIANYAIRISAMRVIKKSNFTTRCCYSYYVRDEAYHNT